MILTPVRVIRVGDPFSPEHLYQRLVTEAYAAEMVANGRAVYPTKPWQNYKMPTRREDGSEP